MIELRFLHTDLNLPPILQMRTRDPNSPLTINPELLWSEWQNVPNVYAPDKYKAAMMGKNEKGPESP